MGRGTQKKGNIQLALPAKYFESRAGDAGEIHLPAIIPVMTGAPAASPITLKMILRGADAMPPPERQGLDPAA